MSIHTSHPYPPPVRAKQIIEGPKGQDYAGGARGQHGGLDPPGADTGQGRRPPRASGSSGMSHLCGMPKVDLDLKEFMYLLDLAPGRRAARGPGGWSAAGARGAGPERPRASGPRTCRSLRDRSLLPPRGPYERVPRGSPEDYVGDSGARGHALGAQLVCEALWSAADLDRVCVLARGSGPAPQGASGAPRPASSGRGLERGRSGPGRVDVDHALVYRRRDAADALELLVRACDGLDVLVHARDARLFRADDRPARVGLGLPLRLCAGLFERVDAAEWLADRWRLAPPARSRSGARLSGLPDRRPASLPREVQELPLQPSELPCGVWALHRRLRHGLWALRPRVRHGLWALRPHLRRGLWHLRLRTHWLRDDPDGRRRLALDLDDARSDLVVAPHSLEDAPANALDLLRALRRLLRRRPRARVDALRWWVWGTSTRLFRRVWLRGRLRGRN